MLYEPFDDEDCDDEAAQIIETIKQMLSARRTIEKEYAE